jgi:hypothetical protein
MEDTFRATLTEVLEKASVSCAIFHYLGGWASSLASLASAGRVPASLVKSYLESQLLSIMSRCQEPKGGSSLSEADRQRLDLVLARFNQGSSLRLVLSEAGEAERQWLEARTLGLGGPEVWRSRQGEGLVLLKKDWVAWEIWRTGMYAALPLEANTPRHMLHYPERRCIVCGIPKSVQAVYHTFEIEDRFQYCGECSPNEDLEIAMQAQAPQGRGREMWILETKMYRAGGWEREMQNLGPVHCTERGWVGRWGRPLFDAKTGAPVDFYHGTCFERKDERWSFLVETSKKEWAQHKHLQRYY